MIQTPQHRPSDRLLVVMPTWVSDCVMAIPTLRALRSLYPGAHIAALTQEKVKPIVDQCPWVDQVITRRRGRSARLHHDPTLTARSGRNGRGFWGLTRQLAAMRFDTAVVLADSFRAALLVRMAKIDRRVGYDRDGRGFLLTDRLLPRRDRGGLVPVSMRDSYLGLAQYLGAMRPDPMLRLFTRPADDADAVRLLQLAGYDPADQRRLVLLCPDAAHGPARQWPAQRFAELADRCVGRLDAAVAISVMPEHARLAQRIKAIASEPILDLPGQGLNLTLLKSIIARSDLVITNDTGPRQIAAAFNTPTVTIIGPSHPAWGHTHAPREQQVAVDVACAPCQKKRCPLPGPKGQPDHRCMQQIDVDMVMRAAESLLDAPVPAGAA